MEWKDHIVKSDGFDNPHGHQNPNSMPVKSYTKEADFVTVGAFRLSKGKCIYCYLFLGFKLLRTVSPMGKTYLN